MKKLKTNYMAMLLIVMVQYWQNEQLFLKCLPVCKHTYLFFKDALGDFNQVFIYDHYISKASAVTVYIWLTKKKKS